MKRLRFFGGMASAGILLMLVVSAFPAQPQQPPGTQLPPPAIAGPTGPQQGNQRPVAAGAPEPFKSKEGKTGWRVTIPGNLPLATPAVSDHKLFLGGGFGSHEFYCFDAKTGKQEWVYKTGDDGPTAAVISGDLIAFNTESCELEIITKAGKRLWKKWLGDPLMSMPAVHDGKVFMAFPDTKGGGGHKLACFDLKTGKEEWKKPITGDIITTPVIDNDRVYLTTLEGTVYNFTCKDGELVWSEKRNATSSPAVHGGRLYYSQREIKTVRGSDGKDTKQQLESLVAQPTTAPRLGVNITSPTVLDLLVIKSTTGKADYLDNAKRAKLSEQEKKYKGNDASVGFDAAPAAANLKQAVGNLGQGTVNGVWSYQGSRPFIYKDNLVSSMGDTVKCVDPKTEKVLWKRDIRDAKDNSPLVDAALTPPAIVNGKLFIGTTAGQVICMNADTGAELWRATVGDPILFQPAVAYGRVFVGTSNGRIYCIETGDAHDHGWMMWGANAAHNGRVE